MNVDFLTGVASLIASLVGTFGGMYGQTTYETQVASALCANNLSTVKSITLL